MVLRQEHLAGEKLFVDYAGATIPIQDPQGGPERPTSIFVVGLGASNYTYAEATESQELENWIGSHIRAFEFLGGVPKLVIPDNTRNGVNRACRYEPDLNRTYHELAMHYGVGVLPTRPYKPRDKAKVETRVAAPGLGRRPGLPHPARLGSCAPPLAGPVSPTCSSG